MPANTPNDAENVKANAAKAAAKAKPAPKPEPIKAAEPAQTDAAETSLADIIAEQRATANAVFGQLAANVSVPVKPLTAYRKTYKADVKAHAIARRPTPRQAAAIAVAQAASGKQLRDKATFARKFDMRGATYAIENGVLSDAIASGIVTYDAANETVTIANAAEIKSQLGSALGSLKL